MSCMHCVYWTCRAEYQWGGDRYNKVKFQDRIGDCTFNPSWVESVADHYCGRFVPDDPAITIRLWKRSGELSKMFEAMKERALKAEKSAKAIRAELKAMKA